MRHAPQDYYKYFRNNHLKCNMDKTLRSIYLRLDVNMQYLTSKAIAQVIVKLVYARNRMSLNDVFEAFAEVNDRKHIGHKEIEDVLNSLVPKEIKYSKGYYYLSSAKRANIRRTIEASEQRKEVILDTYFSRLNSERTILREWLTDVTIKFFEVFSDEWISDLVEDTRLIVRKSSEIKQLITNRTNNYAGLDKDDKQELPNRFFDFVTTKRDVVKDYLWEYGTSAFSSILITNKHGINQLTLETFRNSICILDTNILLFIALESRFQDALGALEKVFQDLNVRVMILYVTKKEYEGRVYHQRTATLHNLESYGYDTTIMADDDFTCYARRLRCKTSADFENFFDCTLSIPPCIKDNMRIELLDNDQELATEVEKAQANESLIQKLKDIYNAVAIRKRKGMPAFIHDVGLLEGVRFLRSRGEKNGEKYFILSEDHSVNQYSKTCGFKQGLPLTLRVDTLINMLAVNNGGDTFDASDYKSLFANLIGMDLVPPRDIFRQTELYEYYKMNYRIANLPKDKVKEIVIEMHRKSLDGEKQNDLQRDLNELVTKGELIVKDELEETKKEVYESQKKTQRLEEANKKTYSALEETIRKQVSDEYDKETKRMVFKNHFKAPLIYAVLMFAFVGSLFMTSSNSVFCGLLISVIASIITNMITHHQDEKKIIRERKQNRNYFIEHETDFRIKKQLG